MSGGCIYKDGYIYGGAYLQPKWFCIDARTGVTKYIDKEKGGGPVIYADSKLYIRHNNALIFATLENL